MKEKMLFTSEGIVRIPYKEQSSLTEIVCSVLCVGLFVLGIGAVCIGMFLQIAK